MSGIERTYRRALRAYPRRWRREHGEAVLSTLLDAAEAQGRDAHAPRELGSLLGHGLGERLNRHSARALCLLAVVIAVAGSVLRITQADTGALPFILSALLAPGLLTAALAGLLREAGTVSHLRAVAGTLLALPAWGLSAFASLSWSVGFDEADLGLPYSPLAEAFVPLFLTSWAIGTAACAVVLSGLLAKSGVSVVPRLVGAVLGGAVAAPMLAILPVAPFGSAGMAVALLVCVLLGGRAPQSGRGMAAPLTTPPPARPRAVTAAERKGVIVTGWFAMTAGLLGAAYALTGSLWFGAGPDATETMRLGMTLGLLAAVPLVLTTGRFLESRRGTPGPLVFSPSLAAVASLGVAAAASGLLLGDDAQWILLMISVAIGAYAAGRAAFLGGLGAPGNRLLLAFAVGAGYALFPGLMAATAGAFAAPVLGIFALFWIRRSPAQSPVPVAA